MCRYERFVGSSGRVDMGGFSIWVTWTSERGCRIKWTRSGGFRASGSAEQDPTMGPATEEAAVCYRKVWSRCVGSRTAALSFWKTRSVGVRGPRA